MKKFKFRLGAILKLRKQQEDEKKRIAGKLLAEINENQNQAIEMAREIEQSRRELKDVLVGKVDLHKIANHQRFVNDIQQAIHKRVLRVSELQVELAKARKELAEASKQYKIMEKLKERREQRYLQETKRREMQQQDEIGTNMFVRGLK